MVIERVIGTGGHAADIAADRCIQFCVDSTEPIPYAYIGINDGQTRRKLDAHEEDFDGVWVHSTAHVGPGVTLGRHTHINGKAFLTRATLGDYCTVGPGVMICGDVTIGDDVSIGAGAVISNLVRIESGTTIGAGAVVPPGWFVDTNTWVGVPARPLYPLAVTVA